jgi:hypothetical protein
MIVFAAEPLAPIWPDIMRLATAHWGETEGYRHGQKFSPDAARYWAFNEMESCGGPFYTMFTARDQGRMVGYAGMYVTASMHTQLPIATEDTWFLLPEYRKGRNALAFYKYVEEAMRKRGVIEIGMTAKLTNGAGRIMEYLGYKNVSLQYSKHLVYNPIVATAGDAPDPGCPHRALTETVMEHPDVRPEPARRP